MSVSVAGQQRSDGDHAIADLVPALRTFAHALHRDPSLADDLVQDTLATALERLDSLDARIGMKSWLFAIMRDAFYAKPYRRDAASEDRDAAEAAAGHELSDASWEMHAAIQRLPQHHREVLVLIGVLEITYGQAAAVCNCAVGTVKSRLSRARNRVRADLASARPLCEESADARAPALETAIPA